MTPMVALFGMGGLELILILGIVAFLLIAKLVLIVTLLLLATGRLPSLAKRLRGGNEGFPEESRQK